MRQEYRTFLILLFISAIILLIDKQLYELKTEIVRVRRDMYKNESNTLILQYLILEKIGNTPKDGAKN